MTEPNIVVVTEVTKEISCGESRVDVHFGAFGFIRIYDREVKFDEIPNLIAALHTVMDITSSVSGLSGQVPTEEPR